jgi:hypothetical protein
MTRHERGITNMDVNRLLEDAVAAWLGREWDQVQALSRQILSTTPLEPWVEGGARRMLAESHLAFSMNKDDTTKFSLRNKAVEEARKSIQAYEKQAQPEPNGLSESYCVLGSALNLLGFVVDQSKIENKAGLNRDAIAATEKSLQLNAANTEAQEQLQKLRKTQGVYSEAKKESSGGGGCFGIVLLLVTLAAIGTSLAKALIR